MQISLPLEIVNPCQCERTGDHLVLVKNGESLGYKVPAADNSSVVQCSTLYLSKMQLSCNIQRLAIVIHRGQWKTAFCHVLLVVVAYCNRSSCVLQESADTEAKRTSKVAKAPLLPLGLLLLRHRIAFQSYSSHPKNEKNNNTS